jgi:hypothetical protein
MRYSSASPFTLDELCQLLGMHEDCETCRVRVLTLMASLNLHPYKERLSPTQSARAERSDPEGVDYRIGGTLC